MRAWWWILITAQLVWANPERFKDDYGNSINVETNENSATEGRLYPSSTLSSKAFYTRIRRRYEDDEREKKQMRFHSWGGKRDGGEEEEELGDNTDREESVVLREPADEDLLTDTSSNLSLNASSLETDGFGEVSTKRRESSPAFYPWGGKRDPEMMNDITVNKRSNYYSPTYQQNSLGSRQEQISRQDRSSSQEKSRKRYPYFSSWAGKRAPVSNSWEGKGEYSVKNEDHFEVKRDYPKAIKGFYDGADNEVDLNNEHNQAHNTLNSNILGSEYSFNDQAHEPNINSDGEHYLKATPKENEPSLSEEGNVRPEFEHSPLKRAAAFNSWGGKRGAAFNSWVGKRAAAFNSWGGKRAPAFNSWGGKRAPAFNSWGGKRGAAFNSWGGKRAAAFNSWGGKRAPAFNSWGGKRAPAFNSWGGKRAPAFNSWGGKRAAAFNSWGGKRAAAFNSWGGKRAAAFNSWGGKRAAAFNSWGGKRAAAFNSWGGKRVDDEWNEKPKFEYPTWNNNRELYGVNFPLRSSQDNKVNSNSNEFIHTNDKTNKNQDYILKHATGTDKNLDNISKNNFYVLFDDEQLMNLDSDGLKNHEKNNNRQAFELTGQRKRSPIFSSWYGGKVPTMLLTNGKRKPAFSSWGGKRSGEHNTVAEVDCTPANTGEEEATVQKSDELHSQELSLPEEKTYTREKRELECTDEKNNSALTIERDKRASGNSPKNRVFTRMMLQGGWPMAFQSRAHGKDFFAWGGKRSLDITTSR